MANTFENAPNAAAYSAGILARAKLKSLTAAVDSALQTRGDKATSMAQIAAAQSGADSAVDAFELAINNT